MAAVAAAGAGSVTATQAASFGSCGCTKTGPFVDAKHGLKPTPNPPSGSPFTIQTTTSGEPPGITDVKVFNGATQLIDMQTQKWGFSPDNGNRFVAWSVDGGTGLMSVQLYDLTSATPQAPIWTGGTPSGTSSAAIQFSPTGHYLQLSAISGASDLYLTIRDARTGAFKLEDTVTPSSAADTGDDNSVAGWGYGPGDLGFVYAFLNGSSEPQLELVNLANGNVRDIGGIGTSASAFWQFSPCGDVLGVVGDPGGGPLLADMYSLDGTHLGEVSGVTAPVALAATSTELTANGTNVAPNTAGQSCGGGGASLVVNFTVAGVRHVGSTLTFNDTSTDSSGTINHWSWDFGDGQTSTAQNPTHSYNGVGTFTVKLTVQDSVHATSSRSKTITIGVNKPPKASFTFTPATPNHGDPVTFTDTSTDDVGVTFIQWTINGNVAGDSPGSSLTVQACTTLHVKLTAFDGDGQSNTTPTTTIPISTAAETTDVPSGGSLADAVAHSCPGDTVNLAAGLYNGGVTLGSVNLVGAGEGQTIIDNAIGATDGWVLTIAPALRNGPLQATTKPTSISDLTVEDGQGGIHVVTQGTRSDITNVEVNNNTSLGGIGIQDPENSGGCGCPNPPLGPATHIDSDYVHNNGGSNGGGLWADFADTTIVTGSEFANNGSSGVALGSGGPFQVMDSYSHDNSFAGLAASNTDGVSGTVLAIRDRLVNNGAGVTTNDPLLLAGDLITGSTTDPALALSQGQDDVTVADSTIAGNDAGGITEQFPNVFHYPIRLENTILGGNGGPDVEAGIPMCRVDGSMIGTLPAFTNDSSYHLAFNSTAIDAGVNARVPAVLATDIDGDRRIQGTAVDIGYDETPGTGFTAPAANPFAPCQAKYQDFGQGPTGSGSSVSTLTTNTTATATDPLETTVTSPTSVSSGYVTIQETLDFSNQTLTGWRDLVSAFPSGSVADPYSIEFILDKSIVTSGLTTNVFLQGVAVPACTGAPSAVPDPCVTDVHTASGDVHVTVLSSNPNGTWQFTQS